MKKINFLCYSIAVIGSTLVFMVGCHKDPPSSINTLSSPSSFSSYEIAAYLPYWGLDSYKNYSYQYITSLYLIATISQQSVLGNKGLIWGDDDTSSTAYSQPPIESMVNYIRGINPNIKIVLALSDLHSTDAKRASTAILFNNTNRSTTINYLMANYVDKFKFDGVDIDFEDTSLDPGYIGSNYPLFIQDLATALHNARERGTSRLCSVSLGVSDYTRSNINSTVFNNADLIGIQDYGREKMDYLLAEPNRDLIRTASNWSALVPKNKLEFGVALYSQYATASGTGSGGAYNYNTLLELKPTDTTFTPYLTTYYNTPGQPSGYVQRYNSMYETRRKAEFVKDGGYKGIFLWDITKDAINPGYTNYSLLKMLNDWNNNPIKYPKIVGCTDQDYYSLTQNITVFFHDLAPSDYNWVGVYNLKTGQSTGYYQYLPNTAFGNIVIPSSLTSRLSLNELYILRFYNGAGGIGRTLLGTSHPFYKQ